MSQLSPFVTTLVPANRSQAVDDEGVPFKSTDWVKYLKWSKSAQYDTYNWFVEQDGGRLKAEPKEFQDDEYLSTEQYGSENQSTTSFEHSETASLKEPELTNKQERTSGPI